MGSGDGRCRTAGHHVSIPCGTLTPSTLIASGLDVLTISRRLGHGSPAITLSVYGHLFKTDHRAAQGMEAAFAGLQ
jgi:integrase